MDELIENITKIHTTEMGETRIKYNLIIEKTDVIAWCKNAIVKADLIIGQGKNWYIYFKGVAITVIAKSYTLFNDLFFCPIRQRLLRYIS